MRYQVRLNVRTRATATQRSIHRLQHNANAARIDNR